MNGFLNWFLAIMTTLFEGISQIFVNLFHGLVKVFNLYGVFVQIGNHSASFGALDWIMTILVVVILIAILVALIYLIVLVVKKYVRFRKTIIGNEDLLEEIAELHRDVMKLTAEKERIMTLKVAQTGLSIEEIKKVCADEDEEVLAQADSDIKNGEVNTEEGKRFYRLSAVDEKYRFYNPPDYLDNMSLAEICADLRDFACYKSKLYYDIRTIRLMLAGLASTKLILLQGISGTGKTSLPYVMGKYFNNDATIASVQPSWRDRNELFGYFNTFTMNFNETEVLRRIYEASFNEDINIIILDEMNIARVEYYFAEMLSILEMPDHNEWKIELVPSSWENDPKHLVDGKLTIPENVWYIGTANNDDSTFAVSDKVYDRAFVINLDKKGVPFEANETCSKNISYSYVESLYKKAIEQYPVTQEHLSLIEKLDNYVIEKFRIAFGNRIIKQLGLFVPVYVACGGDALDGIDYILATKVFRKFESLNFSLIRDEIRGLISFMDKTFGKGVMKESIEYLTRLQKMY